MQERRGPRQGRRRITAVTLAALLAAGTLVVATTGAASAAKASGEPIVIYTVSGEPFEAVAGGVQAAAEAINKAGGVKDPAGGPNRPFKVVWCKEADANSAAKCGREAVDAGALAMVGNTSAYGGQWAPIIFEAGIPFVAGGAYELTTLTDPLSFPINNSLDVMTGGYQFLGKALGMKKSWSVVPDLPSADAINPAVVQANTAAGVDNVGESRVSASETSTPDYAPYAAAAAGSDAEFIWMNIGPGGVSLMQSLLTQGVDFHETAVMASSNAISLSDLKPLGKFKDGVYILGAAYPETYTQNAGVQQYNKEMNAAGITKKGRNDNSMLAWTGMHIVANLFPEMTEVSSAALVEAMNNAGPLQYGPTAPFDWSQPAYSEGFLATLRIFSKTTLPMRVVGNDIVPIVKDFVPNDEPFKVTKQGKISSTG